MLKEDEIMKHTKKVLLLLLLICLALLIPSQVLASEIVDSGESGDNATWTLDSEGVLTISGSGPMGGKYFYNRWNDDQVLKIIIEENITTINDSAFWGCKNLTSITIPDTVTSIGNQVFYNCSSLRDITIPQSVTSIGYSAFQGCSGLTSITIPKSVTSIGDYAFLDCSELYTVIIYRRGDITISSTSIPKDCTIYCYEFTSVGT